MIAKLRTGVIKTVGVWKIHRNNNGAVWAERGRLDYWTAAHTDVLKVQSLKSLPKMVKVAMIEAIAERYEL